MSGTLPALTGAEVIQTLERGGFAVVRTRGAHHFLRHTDGPQPWFLYTLAIRLGRD
jgi:predicted RNA binding protein YcfA (HicA-like mRNA interferase family)